MMFKTPLTALLATMLTVASPAVAEGWAAQCKTNYPVIAQAIHNFCIMAGEKNVVPNDFSKHGVGTTTQFKAHAHCSIVSNCSPGQWVPQADCFSQFYQLCAQSEGHGGSAIYGTNGCQSFRITHTPA